MNDSTLKPWKSMTEQLALLESRGLLVSDKKAALNYLRRIGYYRLSGYWYPLREIDKFASEQSKRPIRGNHFISDSHFEDVVKLYIFDKKLRLLALDALERIEMAIRVDVAYCLGKKHAVAHEEPSCLHGHFTKQLIKKGPNANKTQHEVWLEKYRSLVKRAKQEPFIKHHSEKYNGQLPIWVAIEVWDFGLLSQLFAGMQLADREHIATKYDLNCHNTLAKWLRSLNFIRNVSAHHSRLWNINILEVSPVPQNWPFMNNARPFLYFGIMQRLMTAICPNSSWGNRVADLLNDFPTSKNGSLTLRDMGVCEDWKNWLLIAKNENRRVH